MISHKNKDGIEIQYNAHRKKIKDCSSQRQQGAVNIKSGRENAK